VGPLLIATAPLVPPSRAPEAWEVREWQAQKRYWQALVCLDMMMERKEEMKRELGAIASLLAAIVKWDDTQHWRGIHQMRIQDMATRVRARLREGLPVDVVEADKAAVRELSGRQEVRT
jgi:hypothetical protein